MLLPLKNTLVECTTTMKIGTSRRALTVIALSVRTTGCRSFETDCRRQHVFTPSLAQPVDVPRRPLREDVAHEVHSEVL